MKADFIKKMVNVQSRLKAPKSQYNSFGKYKYRSCEDILEAVKPLLAENGLVLTVSDEITETAGRVYIRATATVTDGEDSISNSALAREDETKKGMDGAQVTGTASSYARKYALNGLLAIDDTKDADAVNDHGKGGAKAPKPEGGTLTAEIKAADKQGLVSIFNAHPELHKDKDFLSALSARKKELGI